MTEETELKMRCIYNLGNCPLPIEKLSTGIGDKITIKTEFVKFCEHCPIRINATQKKESEFTKELEKEFLKAITEGMKKGEKK